jgi:hypothetical protein
MARLAKKNADYFPHPSDRRDDPKVKSLRRKYGHVGYSVYTMLRELIAGADYFHLRVDDHGLEDIAGDIQIEPVMLQEIIGYCCQRHLFQIVIIESIQFITDHDMISDLTELLRKRRIDSADIIRGNYSSAVISATEIQQSKNNRGGNTQSKVKESKVKESVSAHTHAQVSNSKTETHAEDYSAAKNSGAEEKSNAPQPASENKPVHTLAEQYKQSQQFTGLRMLLRNREEPYDEVTAAKIVDAFYPLFMSRPAERTLNKFSYAISDHVRDGKHLSTSGQGNNSKHSTKTETTAPYHKKILGLG